MTTKAGVGMSRHHNPSVAGREAAEQALKNAGLERPDFVFMFGSIGYDQRSLLRAVRETTGGAPLTGCSAEGTLNGDDADESNFSVVVTAISSEELQWTNGSAAGLEADPRAVGQRVAKQLLPDLSADTIGLFVFPDGLKDFVVPTNNLVDNFFVGLEENLPSERFLPMWGGGANVDINSWAPPTYQYCDDEVITDGVSYALLSGKAQAGWAISHACIPIGGERIVTRSKGNIIYEIDGKPAMEVFDEYLPEGAITHDRDWMRYVISLSLCFKAPSYMQDEEYVVRGMPAVSMSDGSITVQTEVKEGTSVWLSSRDKEKVSAGFDRMAHQIKEQLGGERPKLIFQFECATRGKIMFRDEEKQQLLKHFRQSLDPDAPWVGFYTVGEIGPVAEHNLRHLYTSVVLALS